MTISATTQGIKPGVCLSTAKPVNPFDGQVIYMTDVDQTAVWDGTQWTVLAPIASGRNVVINGAMQVHQRGTSTASITSGDLIYRTADRFNTAISSLGTWTESVENDAPTGSGFRKSLKVLCTTADASPAAGDYYIVTQILEGQNLQQFLKGTSSAKQFALSFWVKSNATGTYTVNIRDLDNGRSCAANYSVSSSATWEKKTIIFPADTTGAFDNDNAASLRLTFNLGIGSNYTSGTLQTTWGSNVDANLGVGQTNLAAATNNYWQITGVQLEAGAVATPFEFEDAQVTLAKCQRYYEKSYNLGTVPGTTSMLDEAIGMGIYTNNPAAYNRFGQVYFKVTKRAAPTIVQYAPWTGSTAAASNASAGDGSTAVGYTVTGQINTNGFNFVASVGGSTVTNYNTVFFAYTASAEL